MTSFAKVDVKDIGSDMPRSSFLEKEIEQLADLILESGGLLQPLVLKQTDLEKFIVLDGHLEYFASVRAREKNPRQGEMVHAFVITSKDEAVIQKQVHFLRNLHESTDVPNEKLLKTSESTDQGRSSDWISSFETRLSEIREELFQAKRDHEYRFTKLEKNFQKKQKSDLLDLLNNLEKQDLIDELSRYGLARAKSEAIYNARNQKEYKTFSDYQDVVNATKGLGSSGILRLIDAWGRINRTEK